MEIVLHSICAQEIYGNYETGMPAAREVEELMERIKQRIRRFLGGESSLEKERMSGVLTGEGGMEMVQVAILVAIAIVLGLIFKTEITAFVNKTFDALNNGF